MTFNEYFEKNTDTFIKVGNYWMVKANYPSMEAMEQKAKELDEIFNK